jgi:hypothetical protein
MKRLKGPELKLPQLKTPAVLNDLYYDLRDRRLLPLVALALVAIVAVPFLLGGEPEEAHLPEGAGLSSLGAEKTSKLTVVEATPGLRDYHRRLGHRSPTDPFKQRYTSLPEGAQVEGGGGSEAGGGSPTVVESPVGTTEVPESGSSGGSAPSGGGEEAPAPRYELVIDAQVSHTEKKPDGSEQRSPWEARHGLPVLTKLPSEKTPVATFLGANFQKERLVFLVSHAVKAVSGEYGCALRGEICEVLEVAEGALLEYVYEPTGVRWAIKVTHTDVVPARKHTTASSSRAVFSLSQPGVPPAP